MGNAKIKCKIAYPKIIIRKFIAQNIFLKRNIHELRYYQIISHITGNFGKYHNTIMPEILAGIKLGGWVP